MYLWARQKNPHYASVDNNVSVGVRKKKKEKNGRKVRAGKGRVADGGDDSVQFPSQGHDVISEKFFVEKKGAGQPHDRQESAGNCRRKKKRRRKGLARQLDYRARGRRFGRATANRLVEIKKA